MRIRMTVIVDIDPDRWQSEYGRDENPTAAAVKKDIRTHVTTMIHGSLSIADEDVTVEVK